MTSTAGDLDRSYRQLTRLFPSHYRDAREDEIVSVLMEGASPAQSHATFGEAVDLLRAAAKLWFLLVVGSDRASRSDAAALLAVMLPSAFMYGAGISSRVLTVLPTAAVPDYLRHSLDWAPWAAWAAVTGLLLIRMTRPALVGGLLATLLYVGTMGHTLLRLGPNPFVHTVAWLIVQVAAVGLLVSPERACRGYALVSRRWQLIVGVVPFVLGYTHDWWWAAGRGAAAYWVAAIAALSAGAWLLRRPVGRVIVPVAGGLIGFAAATRMWAGNVADNNHSGVTWLHLTDLLLLVSLPALALVALRLVAALLERPAPASQTAAE